MFDSLPEKVKQKVREDLRIFDTVSVIFEKGEYKVSSSVVLKRTYSQDYRVVGTFTAADIYSPEERMLIYVEEFHDYPIDYKGKKDWDMIRSLTWCDKVAFDSDGNIVKCKE